jgi:hypothetical protein
LEHKKEERAQGRAEVAALKNKKTAPSQGKIEEVALKDKKKERPQGKNVLKNPKRKMRTQLFPKDVKVAKKANKNAGCRVASHLRGANLQEPCDFCTFDPLCGPDLACHCEGGTVGDTVCCPGPCDAPAELNISGEVDGSVVVNGIVMLYFYKARIHGDVDAPNSDIVIAERTRFDGSIFIHYYGTILACEIQNGVQVTGVHLWDDPCKSITLQGFFLTNFHGLFVGPTVASSPDIPCASFIFDAVTGDFAFTNNEGSPIADNTACPVCIGCFIP